MRERSNTFMFKENTKLATFYNKETEFNLTPRNHHPSIISKNMANLFNVEKICADADTMDNVSK